MSKQPNKKGTTMAEKQEMAVREKKELTAKEEKTVPGRHFVPYADIYETDDALSVVLEMPGVEKKDLDVALENDVLRVDGRIDFSKYKDTEPVYAEYNVGHYGRVDSDAKCNPVDSIGSSTKSRVSHSERRPSARFPGDKDGSARRNIEPLQ
jgi:HSP20 family molecular chaperone IbpA